MDKLEQFKETLKTKKEVEERLKGSQENSFSPEEKDLLLKKVAELEAQQEKAKEAKEQYIRLYAEFENFRKRIQKEKEENLRFANERVIKEILPILDNLEKALEHAKIDANKDSLINGVELVYKQFLSILEAFGVTPVPSVGKAFDPHHHEAMAHEESDDHEPHTVVQEYRRGYKMHDKLIRPSLVTVAKPSENKKEKKSKRSSFNEEE